MKTARCETRRVDLYLSSPSRYLPVHVRWLFLFFFFFLIGHER